MIRPSKYNAFLTNGVPLLDKKVNGGFRQAGPLNHSLQEFVSIPESRVLSTAAQTGRRVNQESLMRRLIKFLRCEKGANAIEYALVASLIAIAAVAAFKQLGSSVDSMMNNVSSAMV